VRIIMTIPIYQVERLDQAGEMARLATNLGLAVTLYCNSAAARDEAIRRGLSVDSACENVGYGRAANLSVKGKDFDWVIVCNDDLSVDRSDFASYISTLDQQAAGTEPWVVGLADAASTRRYRIPGPVGVFTGLSLLQATFARIKRVMIQNKPTMEPGQDLRLTELRGGEAFPFICVAINRSAWLALAGFDPRFDLYYEDMDFLIRLSRLTDAHVAVVPVRMRHLGSASTRQQLEATLPVAAWSAYEYLVVNNGLNPRPARLLVAAALTLRLVLVPFASGSRIRHIAGIAKSLAAIVFNARPRLAAWQR
jgi:N-acetylglucosaminyl-diphospho-decaprenol L-rhamnosyltransferase